MVSSDDVPQESVIQYTVDIPEALPPNLHGEGAHTLYCCTVMAERPHALARRTISWCAPLRLVAAPPRRRCRGSLPANSPPRQIHKRYSQFHDLRCSLVELLSDRSSKTKRAKQQREQQQDMADAVKLLPELPPKIWVGNNFARGTVEDRRLKLRSFLLALVALPNAAQLELVRDFLGQPDEVLMPTSEDVALPALAPGLSSPGTWRAQAQRGWRLGGCRDDLYNGVYHLCKDEAGANRLGATHCVNGQGKHLYVGPTGKWYINNRFSTGDECKAFYHRRRQDRRLSVPEPAALPLRVFLASQGLDDMHDPLHELGAECLSDLADVTDAEFAECGVPLDKGEWLRGQAQAVRGKGGEAATPEGGGAAGIPEGVPNEDGGM